MHIFKSGYCEKNVGTRFHPTTPLPKVDVFMVYTQLHRSTLEQENVKDVSTTKAQWK